jgi:hypothetical protein
VFVALSTLASAAGGAALVFGGVRLAKLSRTRSGFAATSESEIERSEAARRRREAGGDERDN